MIIGVHCDRKHAKLFTQCVKDLNFIENLNFRTFEQLPKLSGKVCNQNHIK